MQYELSERPSSQERAELEQQFQAHIRKHYALPDESEDKTFIINIRSTEGKLLGGILANAYWDGLEIETLWVDSKHREQGLGQNLLERAEEYGREHGAVIAFLKTVDALAFYEKRGYKVFGVLEDRPIGSTLYHLKKRLD